MMPCPQTYKSLILFAELHWTRKNTTSVNQIFEIIFYSKGGFTFTEVYNLPIFLRNYYHKRLVKEYEEMNKETKKEMSKIKSNPNTKK